ncbi:hypothetical protein LCGC14_0786000, partial [marine sediment metagenome]
RVCIDEAFEKRGLKLTAEASDVSGT